MTENRRAGALCAAFTFFFGLAAHAYGYFSNAFSHDSLNAFISGAAEDRWKLSLGRLLVPALRLIRGNVTLPWLIGLIALSLLALSSYFFTRLFKLSDPHEIALVCGLLCVNTCVTAITGAYIYELDFDMLSVFLSFAAAYLFYTKKRGYIPAAALLTCGLCLYQANISVFAVTALGMCARGALNGEDTKKLIKQLLGAALTAAAATGAYALILFAAGRVLNISYDTGTANSVLGAVNVAGVLSGAARAAIYSVKHLLIDFLPNHGIVLSGAAFGCLCALCAAAAARKAASVKQAALAAVCAALMPLCGNIAGVVTQTHYLMTMALWVIPCVFAALISGEKRVFIKRAAWALTAAALFSNLCLSNTLYIKKDMEADAARCLITRMVCALDAEKDYVPGETEIVIVGRPDTEGPDYGNVSRLTGAGVASPVYNCFVTEEYNAWSAYFRFVLQLPINPCGPDRWNAFQFSDAVSAMPVFPAEGSVAFIDGVCVVKMGEIPPDLYPELRESLLNVNSR